MNATTRTEDFGLSELRPTGLGCLTIPVERVEEADGSITFYVGEAALQSAIPSPACVSSRSPLCRSSTPSTGRGE